MTHIETAGMSIEELRIAIERHMFEAELHMRTAEALLELATVRGLDIERGTKGRWVQ